MVPDKEDSSSEPKPVLADLAPLFRKRFDDLFGTRARLNRELWDTLQISKMFLQDVDAIREKEKIPTLNPKSDFTVRFVPIEDGDVDIPYSYYFDSLGSKSKKRLEGEITHLLNSYALPLNFHDHIWYIVLYRQFPKGIPRYNWGFLDQIIENPKEAQRLSISTAEKKFWLTMFRHRVGIKKGRVPKQYAKVYQELQNLLDSSPKNKHRRMRTFDSAMEALEHDGSSLSLAVELIPFDEATAEKENRLAANIRQRKSRLLKRHKKVEN